MANKKNPEAVYSRDELIHHAVELFQAKPEAVIGALHSAGKNEFTVDEARRLVGQFLKGKVL
ncbi:hypothetical protein J4772_30090 [Cohnella sp. LGH]|uniref:YqzN/YkzM domain-containing protein n=1 Tax=Cohnella phaseoli TaxID=456490 RepID=A0A3D9KFM0_9BACL|nr:MULTISPECIES: hypothetical protein [Cohnella]QTH41736.1 hypothetical protein J4772_30090 [Cohnella sp. LGH]RED85301.1 hypothetical protein DFP98_1046 [Cohnella phaseoli]